MQEKREYENRRGSLSISALLNEDTIDPINSNPSIIIAENNQPLPSLPSPSPPPPPPPPPPPLLPPLSHRPSSDAITTTTSTESHLSKAKRKRISPHQYSRLMETFHLTDTPSSEIRENLALELKMTKREVQVWFQNRRAKMSRLKNMNKSHHQQQQQQQSSTIDCYSMKPTRRPSAHSLLESHYHNPYPQPVVKNLPSLHNHPYLYKQPKESAIDLLASAAEYVQTDSAEEKEIN
ncbi:uncharacterized protein BX663DRAFT_517821 [Cokeromyces recurvatus]|uniref:uncharacterized protein n=1 Tax=Cokeromyces recurvatus TaxID=90255 RepID=UPI00221F35E4|nr:uncharacterized protein BX663DRAFT_517821 [Cokeromyces recurvatus]KAI7900492.1 hypothetical protein BX663DRAFT_517821 [Cokeromyces recurvatus]